jgi:hypothetical protein
VAFGRKILLGGAMKLVQFADICAKSAFPVPFLIIQLEGMKSELAQMQEQEKKVA